MNLSYVDLHCHSTASDGTLSPAEVVQLARRNGLTALALTDHDTVGGVAEAAAEAAKLGLGFLPGIEISAEMPAPGTLHILGYGVDPASPSLVELTRQLIEGRDNRNPQMVAKLNELGVAVTMAEWEAEAKGLVLGRPQLAAILVRKGYVSSIKDAFNKYLGQGAAAYADKERLTSRRALEMIRESGGLPVLAHAAQLRTENDGQLDTIVRGLVEQGLAGIEVFHSDHDAPWVEKTIGLAQRYHLLKTGGSDFHGTNKKDIDMGLARGRRVPRELFDQLEDACAAARRSVAAGKTSN
jgi:predicted metal-dependent phosphoesterase TrpH